jgi:outer membrane protein assembly factor BamE (lipoprotein component of BamABCDE complex)
MNLRCFTLIVFTPCILGVSSCATNPRQKRISNNPDLYNALSAKEKSLINNGQIKQGMNKKAVYLAWGDPSRSSKGENNGTLYERWYYYNYTPYYTGSFFGGYGHGRGYY